MTIDGRLCPTSGPLYTVPWVRFEIVLAMSDKMNSCACYAFLVIVQYVYTSTLNVPCAMQAALYPRSDYPIHPVSSCGPVPAHR